MSVIIGIDLGTTNSCVAFIENGQPVVIANEEGARTTPSMVAVTESGEELIGLVAKRQLASNPERTVYATKRLIGLKYDTDEVKQTQEMVSYGIQKHQNGDAWIRLNDQPVSPQEISAKVLARLKKTAEAYLNQEVSDAVITVPAYFNDSQRQATRDAGRLAGLNVKRIVNEPTAAALAYGLGDKTEHRRVAVYDMGGGTFDISVLELREGVFQVKATHGDTFLGGEDFDRLIIDWIVGEFYRVHQHDLKSDIQALSRIKEAAEKAKHQLSSEQEARIDLPFICVTAAGPQHFQGTLSRDAFNTMAEPLVRRSIECCKQALVDSKITLSDLNDVLLVGGQTRMPLIQEAVEKFFGLPPNREINPDEVVAIGAAVQGGILSGTVKNVVLLDVTPLTLAVETQGGVATAMIHRNATIPCQHKMIFSTTVDNQSMVNVHVTQGERPMSEDNKTLARFELTGIPPAPRGVPQIQVTFEIDADGIVSVRAQDLGTGKAQEVRITASSGLSEEEVAAILEEAELKKDTDRDKKAFADIQMRSEGLLYAAERALTDYAHIMTDEQRELLEETMASVRKASAENDIETLEEGNNKLEALSHELASIMYEGSDAQDADLDDLDDLDL